VLDLRTVLDHATARHPARAPPPVEELSAKPRVVRVDAASEIAVPADGAWTPSNGLRSRRQSSRRLISSTTTSTWSPAIPIRAPARSASFISGGRSRGAAITGPSSPASTTSARRPTPERGSAACPAIWPHSTSRERRASAEPAPGASWEPRGLRRPGALSTSRPERLPYLSPKPSAGRLVLGVAMPVEVHVERRCLER